MTEDKGSDSVQDSNFDQTPQVGDIVVEQRAVPTGTQYAWAGAHVNGLPDPADVTLTVGDGESENVVTVGGRRIRYDGEADVGGPEGGPLHVTLPDNWDYVEGESRHAAEPPHLRGIEDLQEDEGWEEREWPSMAVSGLEEPAHVKILGTAQRGVMPELEVNGRLIRYDGFIAVHDSFDPSVELPDNWDYAQGPSRHTRAVPAVTPLGPAQFDFQVNRFGRKSIMEVNGQRLDWARKVTLEVTAKGTPRLEIEGLWLEGLTKGHAIPRLVAQAVASGDMGTFDGEIVAPEHMLALIAERAELPGSDFLQGSCHIRTPEGPRLATFSIALSAPLRPEKARTQFPAAAVVSFGDKVAEFAEQTLRHAEARGLGDEPEFRALMEVRSRLLTDLAALKRGQSDGHAPETALQDTEEAAE